MIPALKRKDEASASMPADNIVRQPDEAKEYGLLDSICEDLMKAIKSDNHSLLKEAIQALVEHIQDMDEEQDEKE